MEKYLAILGKEVEDKVTGRKGIALSVSYDLTGCVQVYFRGKHEPKRETQDLGDWVDYKRLEIKGKAVMPVPDFGSPPGPSEIQRPRSGHR